MTGHLSINRTLTLSFVTDAQELFTMMSRSNQKSFLQGHSPPPQEPSCFVDEFPWAVDGRGEFT